jgi:hypothetical protein
MRPLSLHPTATISWKALQRNGPGMPLTSLTPASLHTLEEPWPAKTNSRHCSPTTRILATIRALLGVGRIIFHRIYEKIN